MPFSTTFVVQGQQIIVSVNSDGDYNGVSTELSTGQLKLLTSGPIPNQLTELIISTDIGCTIDGGEADPLTLAAGGAYIWSDKSGVPCYFHTANTLTQFAIQCTDEGEGTVNIGWKTDEAILD